MSTDKAELVLEQMRLLGRTSLGMAELASLLESDPAVRDEWLDRPASGTGDLALVVARFVRRFGLDAVAPALAEMAKPGAVRPAGALALLPAWMLEHGTYHGQFIDLISRALEPQPWTPLPTGDAPPLTLGGEGRQVLLRANRPTTVQLRVPADLRFRQVSIRLTGQALVRDLAAGDDATLSWGGERRSVGSGASTVTLRQPARIAAVVFTSGRLGNIIKDLLETKDPQALGKALFAACVLQAHRRYQVTKLGIGHPGAVVDWSDGGTKKMRLDETLAINQDATVIDLAATPHGAGDDLAWHALSPSCARAVAVAVGDDTPQQVLGAELADGVAVTTRDLTGAFQAALARMQPEADGQVRIPIPLLSVQDGLVAVEVLGVGLRCATVAPLVCDLLPLQPCVVPLPTLTAAPGAQVQIRSQGTATGGVFLDLGITATPARFAVLVDERLHIAQALRLPPPDPPPSGPTGDAATLVAVWLCLESLPTAAAPVRLALAAISGDGFTPGNELGTCTATLPVDNSAYEERTPGCWWYRVPWMPGLVLDGVQTGQALVLMASGDATGLRLMHARLDDAVAPVPAATGAGSAHHRHLDRDRSWRQRLLAQQATRWLMAIEVAPRDDTPVVELLVGDGAEPSRHALHGGGGRLRPAVWSGAATSLHVIAQVATRLELAGEVTAPP